MKRLKKKLILIITILGLGCGFGLGLYSVIVVYNQNMFGTPFLRYSTPAQKEYFVDAVYDGNRYLIGDECKQDLYQILTQHASERKRHFYEQKADGETLELYFGTAASVIMTAQADDPKSVCMTVKNGTVTRYYTLNGYNTLKLLVDRINAPENEIVYKATDYESGIVKDVISSFYEEVCNLGAENAMRISKNLIADSRVKKGTKINDASLLESIGESAQITVRGTFRRLEGTGFVQYGVIQKDLKKVLYRMVLNKDKKIKELFLSL